MLAPDLGRSRQPFKQIYLFTAVCLSSLCGGLDCPNSCSVYVQHGPENRMAGHRRTRNAQQLSHHGSEIILCPYDGWRRFKSCFKGLSRGVCSVCSCFDRAMSCGVVFSSVRHVRNGETQFSNFICRNVSEMRRVRWDFRPSTRSVFLAGIAWVQSWRASPAITKRLSGWSRRSMCLEDFCEANRITHAESKLSDAIVSPKQGRQSIWAEMPCPG